MREECYMVLSRRKSGLPSIVKAMYSTGDQTPSWLRQALHHDHADAVAAMNEVNKELGGNYAGVFHCVIEVIEDKTGGERK